MRFENFLTDLRGTSKPKEKLEILKEYDSDLLKTLIHSAYDPFILFHVNIKSKDVPPPGDKDLFDVEEEVRALLHFCENSKSNKKNREQAVKVLGVLTEGCQELLVNTLNKNWKSGLSTKGILKLYPELFSQFEVQLSNTYDSAKKAHNEVEEWFTSYKLDGLRCIALRGSSDEIYDKGRWTLYTRKGKEFFTVEHLKSQLEAIYQRTGWTFFDGELYKHGLQFEEIQGLAMRFTQGQSPELEYHIFVAGDAKKFMNCEDPNHVTVLKKDSFADENFAPDIHYVGGDLISSEEIYDKLEEAFDAGYEGIMLRNPNQLYDYKRSHALLKIKQGEKERDDNGGETISDCTIVGVEVGDFPVIDKETKVLSYQQLILKLVLLQEDGITTKTGGGLTLDFRQYYTPRTEELINMKVEIKHQGWGRKGRMRFPRLFRLREDL